MITIGLLSSGAFCIGTLKEPDGDFFDVFILLVKQIDQDQSNISCALVSPFAAFGLDKPMPKVEKHHVLSTCPAPQGLMSAYTERVTGIVTATPADVARITNDNRIK